MTSEPRPYFEVGEVVIVKSRTNPEVNGEYTIHQIVTKGSLVRCRVSQEVCEVLTEDFFYLMDVPVLLQGRQYETTFCESVLRKKYPPSSQSFSELMNTLKNPEKV